MDTRRQDVMHLWPGEQPGFGYKRTPQDVYDTFAIIHPPAGAVAYPPRIDLTWKMSPVRNQGPHASCVGFATAAALEIVPNAVGVPQDESERFLWYNAKARDGLPHPETDRGTFIDTAIGVTQVLGSCWEARCPYTSPLDSPDAGAYNAALNMKVTNAYRLPGTTLNDYKAMLSIG